MTAHDPSTAYTERRGTVVLFDDHAGLGTIAEDDQPDWPFHCTSIADGTRTIAVGTEVTFRVRPGPTGLEPFEIAPAG
ncbi:MAG: cold shock domain-containing protein [Actinobacteria bacterium]|nr:cold shock domain-containing protein [Actinomycetota bacterium]